MEKTYKSKRFPVSMDSELLNKVDEIKNHPHWRGNRSKVIAKAVEEFLNQDFAKQPNCIFCNSFEYNSKWRMMNLPKGLGICDKCVKRSVRSKTIPVTFKVIELSDNFRKFIFGEKK